MHMRSKVLLDGMPEPVAHDFQYSRSDVNAGTEKLTSVIALRNFMVP